MLKKPWGGGGGSFPLRTGRVTINTDVINYKTELNIDLHIYKMFAF